MNTKVLVRLCLISMAVIIPISIIALAPRYPTKREMERETDIKKVFAALPEQCEYSQIRDWCGLVSDEATSEESADLQERAQADTNPNRLWCGPLARRFNLLPPRTYAFPTYIRWYRLRHPTDRKQWIGIGVFEQHNTGWTAYWITCRVAVGFEPDA